jgi:hypothetical protein
MSSKQTATVVFNVGGTTYEVSRSLLEKYPNTMLARMTSETWDPQDDNCDQPDAKPFFIERDSERFGYCLDYMRDAGHVFLPYTVSKEAFLQDLAYYGFDAVDVDAVTVVATLQIALQSATAFSSLLEEHGALCRYQALAHICASTIHRTGNLTVNVSDISLYNIKSLRFGQHVANELMNSARELDSSPRNALIFQECLALFGLEVLVHSKSKNFCLYSSLTFRCVSV